MDPGSAALGWCSSGDLLRGKRLQAVDVDCVLYISHLKLEELRIAAKYTEGPVVQGGRGALCLSWRTKMHSAVCSAPGIASEAALPSLVLCGVEHCDAAS